MNSNWIERNYKTLIIIMGVFFVLFTLAFFQSTVDDSYITYRYAKNLIEHGVWNWNASGEKVEAYTNFLYAVLAIMPEVIKINTPLFFKIIGFISILYLAVRGFYLIENRLVFLLALSCLILNPYIYIHAYAGLETIVFIVLVFELVIFLTCKKDISIIDERIFFIILLLLPLVRPEGAVFSLIGFFCYLYKERRIQSIYFLSTIIFIAIGYFVWRYHYFGYLFPNTFYVKSTNGFSLSRFLKYGIDSFAYLSLACIIFFIIRDGCFRILLVVAFLVNILVYANSDLHMNFADRFPIHTLFPFFLASFVLLKNSKKVLVVFFVMVFILGGMYSNRQKIMTVISYYPGAIQSHAKLGMALSKYKDYGLTLMLGDAGIIPYFSEWKSYDSIGLGDTIIAHEGISYSYFKNANPDLIALYSDTPNEAGLRLRFNQKEIHSYIQKSQNYVLVGFTKRKRYMLYFLKKDVPLFEDIKKTIQTIGQQTEDFKISKKDYLLQKYLLFP